MPRYREIPLPEIKQYFAPRTVYMAATPNEVRHGATQTYIIQPGPMEGSVSIELPTLLPVDQYNQLINPTRSLDHGVSSQPLVLQPQLPEINYYNLYILMGHLREVIMQHPTASGQKRWRFFLGDLENATDVRIAMVCINREFSWLNANIPTPIFKESDELKVLHQERVIASPQDHTNYCYAHLSGKLLKQVRQAFLEFRGLAKHDEA